jgi:hypothetical protein
VNLGFIIVGGLAIIVAIVILVIRFFRSKN